jgi:hypothetical protein
MTDVANFAMTAGYESQKAILIRSLTRFPLRQGTDLNQVWT